jgi:hypothetical protein
MKKTTQLAVAFPLSGSAAQFFYFEHLSDACIIKILFTRCRANFTYRKIPKVATLAAINK